MEAASAQTSGSTPATPGGMGHGAMGGMAPDHHAAEREFPLDPEPAIPSALRAELESSRKDLEDSRDQMGPTARDLEEPAG